MISVNFKAGGASVCKRKKILGIIILYAWEPGLATFHILVRMQSPQGLCASRQGKGCPSPWLPSATSLPSFRRVYGLIGQMPKPSTITELADNNEIWRAFREFSF